MYVKLFLPTRLNIQKIRLVAGAELGLLRERVFSKQKIEGSTKSL